MSRQHQAYAAKFRIKSSAGWLDGLTSTEIEWTQDKARSWQMHLDAAERRLKQVQVQFPDAEIVRV